MGFFSKLTKRIIDPDPIEIGIDIIDTISGAKEKDKLASNGITKTYKDTKKIINPDSTDLIEDLFDILDITD